MTQGGPESATPDVLDSDDNAPAEPDALEPERREWLLEPEHHQQRIDKTLATLASEFSPVLTTPPPVDPKTVLVLMSVPEMMLSSNFVVLRRRAAISAAMPPRIASAPAPIAHVGVFDIRSSKNEGLAPSSAWPTNCATQVTTKIPTSQARNTSPVTPAAAATSPMPMAESTVMPAASGSERRA